MSEVTVVEYVFFLDPGRTFQHRFQLDNLLGKAFSEAGLEALNISSANPAKKYLLIRPKKEKVEVGSNQRQGRPATLRGTINKMTDLNKFKI